LASSKVSMRGGGVESESVSLTRRTLGLAICEALGCIYWLDLGCRRSYDKRMGLDCLSFPAEGVDLM